MDALASFGPYSILRAIAETRDSVSFAASFEGRKDKAHVLALKVLRDELSGQDNVRNRLVEEMGLAVRLNHVNVAQVFDLGFADGNAYVALEFVDGIPVSMVQGAVASGQKAVTTEVAAFVCAESCAGLAYAHGRRDERGNILGIVHTRVSPRSVLLSKSGLVKVVDFGLARALTEEAPHTADELDLNYMAPEVVRGESYDQRADVFSVGALAYLLLTGRAIYEGARDEDLEAKARQGYVPAIRDLDESVPEALAELVDKALAPNAEDRFEDATALRSGLAAWLRRNSPGFGRHRLKNYMTRLLPDATYGLLPDRAWEPLHRKNFRCYDGDSLLVEDALSEPDVPSEKESIRPLLANPTLPVLERLDVSAMDTGAHRMVRDQAFAAARARGGSATASVPRPAPAARKRVRTPPPMPPVADEVFAARPYDDAEPADAPAPGDALTSAAPASAPEPAATPETAPAADAASPATVTAPAASPEPVDTPAPRSAAPAPASAGDDDPFDVPMPEEEDAPGDVQIDPSMVYDDSIDVIEQRAAVAEADAVKRPVRPTGTIIGMIVGAAILAGLGYGVKWFIDQQAAPAASVAAPSMVFITSRPQGADILIDGQRTAFTTPSPLRELPASAAQITVELLGFDAPTAQTLDPAAPPSQLAFELVPTEHRIRIDSDPAGATVILDGEIVGTTPTELGPLRVDYRQGVDLVLQLPGYLDEHVSVDWAPGETESSVRRPLHIDPDYVPPEEE